MISSNQTPKFGKIAAPSVTAADSNEPLQSDNETTQLRARRSSLKNHLVFYPF
jgi:hypothetical protein